MGGIETGASTMRLVVLAAIDPAARDTVAGGWLLGDDSVAVLHIDRHTRCRRMKPAEKLRT